MSTFTQALTKLLLIVTAPQNRDERGLSQSTENAILLAGTMPVD